jgi:N-acetylglucosaminyldiphosphoundecaprenol N-acetyl-beta-D-mannosaminyltransferase
MTSEAVASVRILDVPVSVEPRARVLESVGVRIRARVRGGHIAITNTESMYHALRQPLLLKYIQGAQHSLCDGVGVKVAGWFWGARIKRYTGPVFLLDCVEHGVAEGWRHFFYGGKPGVAEEMRRRLSARFPGMQCAGTYTPPFRPLTPEEDRDVVEIINQSKPDFVWVGLGLPKQEQWIAEHLDSIDASWMVGVGAAFDFHSGAVPWAPPLMRAVGLEWVFRLMLEPRLRARRYWWSFLYVLEAAAKGLLRGLINRKAAPAQREVA